MACEDPHARVPLYLLWVVWNTLCQPRKKPKIYFSLYCLSRPEEEEEEEEELVGPGSELSSANTTASNTNIGVIMSPPK